MGRKEREVGKESGNRVGRGRKKARLGRGKKETPQPESNALKTRQKYSRSPLSRFKPQILSFISV